MDKRKENPKEKPKKAVEKPTSNDDAPRKSLKRKLDENVASEEAKAAEAPQKKPKFTAPTENWKKLLATMPKTEPKPKPMWLKKREAKRQKEEAQSKPAEEKVDTEAIRKKAERKLAKPTSDSKELTKMIGLDCEMVGVGPQGRDSALARVVIINSYGNVVYDRHVKAKETIVDYRTKYSGIRREDLIGASPFDTVQKEVADMIKDRIVIGHGLKNDFAALMLHHPYPLTRDTAKYRPLQRAKGRPHSLKYLAKALLGVAIQGGEHDPAEDARAAMLIYKKLKKDWELKIKRKKFGPNLGRKDENGTKKERSEKPIAMRDVSDDEDEESFDELDELKEGDDWSEDASD